MANWVVRCQEGVGNQLFQYAFAKYLECKYGVNVSLDVSYFGKASSRVFELDILPLNIKLDYQWIIKLRPISERCIWFSKILHILRSYRFMNKFSRYSMLRETDFNIDSLNINEKCHFVGWFQTKKYIEYISSINSNIISFEPQTTIPKPLECIYKDIISSNSVALHVRRGDYTLSQNKDWALVCNPEYYNEAIKFVKQKEMHYGRDPRFFVFSDDPEWVKKNVSSHFITDCHYKQ